MRKINQCINQNLQALCSKTHKLQQIDALVKIHLPESLKETCQVMSFTKGTLKLALSDSILATELRYFLPMLRDLLRIKQKLYALSNIKFEIILPLSSLPPKENICLLSAKSKAKISLEAHKIMDEEIKNSLLHLARR